MSYRKRKIKKSKLNQLKYKLELVKLALLKRARALFQKEGRMRLPQTARIMEFLRRQNKIIRLNNKKIEYWVDEYINDCILNGRSAEILTQWCVAKDLEKRYEAQGRKFLPLKDEQQLIEELVPRIVNIFLANGLNVNWWITMNRSYLDCGRMAVPDLESKYFTMLRGLIQNSLSAANIILLDWEDEILKARPRPAKSIQNNIFEFVSKSAFQVDLVRHMAWARNDAGLVRSDEDLKKDLEFKIACEAEEGRFLLSPESPFPNGEFILVPLEQAERYVFFSILAPDFQKRLVSILKPNIWRMNP